MPIGVLLFWQKARGFLCFLITIFLLMFPLFLLLFWIFYHSIFTLFTFKLQ